MVNGLNTDGVSGLSQKEAAARLVSEGPNEQPGQRSRTWVRIALEVVKEPMFILLLAGGAIYLALGDVGEAALLLGFVVVVMGITLYQERKTERALEALRQLSSPRALVIRDGQAIRVAGREVVQGDLLVLSEGDRVPADATLVSPLHLAVDESLLTGESLPVRKRAATGDPQPARPGGDDLPFVYSGSMVVQGQGLARVTATGARTELGRIGRALEALTPEPTLLQRETSRLVRLVALGGLMVCGLVVLAYGLLRQHWLEGLLSGVALAMALLPEEIPVIFTIFLALGAWRIAQQHVLTRRAQAIETLGSATVLCVDKTGTLTENRMRVVHIRVSEMGCDLTGLRPQDFAQDFAEVFHATLEFGVLASHPDAFDPMERALQEAAESLLIGTEHLHGDWRIVREYPLTRELLALSHVYRAPDSKRYVIAAKGAPEAIMELCHLAPERAAQLSAGVDSMAKDGLRVLGVARAYFEPEALPDGQHDFAFEFLGLIGFEDPVRDGVPEAVAMCRMAGVRVVMITGDHIATAQQIGRRIGLVNTEAVLMGTELEAMTDAEVARSARHTNLFARVVPEQKLKLVNALKASGEIVAMTGDGVNDAPALRAAHIGVAMGARGTDVAREAASLVLLDDNFASIVQAVRLGRRIFDNLRKAFTYVTAIHVPIAGVSLLPVLFGWPLVLSPVQIVFLELIIDPACSVVFEAEPEEADVMQRPPRNLNEPMFDARTIFSGLLQGIGALILTLGALLLDMGRGRSEAEARAFAFTILILTNLALILVNRSWSQSLFSSLRVRNPALWWVMGGALGLLPLVLSVPVLRDLFGFAPLEPLDVVVSLVAVFVAMAWFEAVKWWLSRRQRSSNKRGARHTPVTGM